MSYAYPTVPQNAICFVLKFLDLIFIQNFLLFLNIIFKTKIFNKLTVSKLEFLGCSAIVKKRADFSLLEIFCFFTLKNRYFYFFLGLLSDGDKYEKTKIKIKNKKNLMNK